MSNLSLAASHARDKAYGDRLLASGWLERLALKYQHESTQGVTPMAIETPHKHIGFNVQFDSLIQRGTIHVNPLDWADLHANTTRTASEFSGSIEDAANDTQINATQVGPISGPDAGTGPLIAVSGLADNIKLPPAPYEPEPHEISPVFAEGQEEHAGEVVSTPDTQPYPTSDVPAVPTSDEGLLPEFEPAPLPEHPAIENESPEHHEG